MEKEMGVWLDSEKAFLISLDEQGESVSRIDSDVEHRVRFRGEKKGFHRLGGMLSNRDKAHLERKKHQLSSYFHLVMNNLKEADKIFIFGPSTTKDWLEREIRKNHDLNSKLAGVENSDSVTERQMIARTREFFNEHQQKRIKN